MCSSAAPSGRDHPFGSPQRLPMHPNIDAEGLLLRPLHFALPGPPDFRQGLCLCATLSWRQRMYATRMRRPGTVSLQSMQGGAPGLTSSGEMSTDRWLPKSLPLDIAVPMATQDVRCAERCRREPPHPNSPPIFRYLRCRAPAANPRAIAVREEQKRNGDYSARCKRRPSASALGLGSPS
jgi:hypothetical protein